MSQFETVSVPDPIPAAALNALFPLQRDTIVKDGFEFALTLAGTVSAGAYTAGVLDYILEALDVWQREKEAGNASVPKHEVVLSTITGTSGGAINGAIFLRVAGFGFPHGPVTANPFYNVWVKGVGLSDLLSADAKPAGLRSLFNTMAFGTLATKIVTADGPDLGSDANTPKSRGFLADPLRYCAMVANVTGIPYRINFRGETKLGHDLVGHADYVRFGLTVPQGCPNSPQSRPDEFALSTGTKTNWDLVATTALCTSAFPAAFPSQALSRRSEMLGYRVAVVPGEKPGTAEIAQLVPLWDSLGTATAGGVLTTTNVDGGTVNNEPLDEARLALAGYNSRNKRGAAEADRAVVLIDPFSDPETLGPSQPPGFLQLLGPLLNTLIYQARMKPEDIALANDYDTFSRFLVAPYGPGGGAEPVAGSSAIAAGGLGGFLGFIDETLLDYDFCLGRRNAYEFLKSEFVLAENHPMFNPPRWTPEQREAYQVPQSNPKPDRPAYYLPIIPLMPSLLASPPALAAWPRQAGVPANLSKNIETRLECIYGAFKSDLQMSGKWLGTVGAFALNQTWSLFFKGMFRDKLVGVFQDGLKTQDLLKTTVRQWPFATGQAAAAAAQRQALANGAKTATIISDPTNWTLTTVWP